MTRNLRDLAMKAFVLFVSVFVVSAGVAQEAAFAAQQVKLGGTLRVGVKERFTGFDPYEQGTRINHVVTMNVFDTLITYEDDYALVPQLASGWETPDENTWVLQLRNDVTFHDGTAFDADAAKFSLERWLAGPYQNQGELIEAIKVVDKYTLEIKTSQNFPALLAILTQPYTAIVSPTAYEEAAGTFRTAPVGTGPFELVSYDSASGRTELRKNANYWGSDASGMAYPYLNGVVFTVLPDPTAAALALRAGDVDLIDAAPAPMIAQLAGDSTRTKVSVTPTTGWIYSFLNVNKPPFDDVARRRAVQLGVDRQQMTLIVERGHGVPALGPLAPTSWAYDPDVNVTGFYKANANPERARAELQAASPPGRFGFTLTYPNEEPFTLIAPVIQGQLAQIGIDVKLDGREIGAVLDDMFASNFEALLIDWSGRIDEDLSTGAFFRCDGANNFGGFCDEEIDRLLAEAATARDTETRAALYRQAQTLINEEAPTLVLYYPTDQKPMRTDVHGFINRGDQLIRLYNVWLDR